MAINISTPIVTVDGILLNTSYGRIQIANEFSGKKISAILLIYPAKLSFTSNYYPLRTELESAYSFSYDREIDGSDTLLLAHNYIISELSKVGISATADLV